jgi:hypothetical protein
MDIKAAKLTKQGKPIEGDPLPGKYYRVEVPEGVDVKAAALGFKKEFPKSFFAFRTSSRPLRSSVETPEPLNTKAAKGAKNLTPEP